MNLLSGILANRSLFVTIQNIAVVVQSLPKRFLSDISNMATEETLLADLDATQVSLLQEECILVNEKDHNIGMATKKDCHLLTNINKGMLHRAFSVFLFDTDGRLLLQQRATSKITFPDHFTNTCCSHPLYKETEIEESGAIGVRRAAQRRLHYELGIEPKQVPVEDMWFITRIHYKSDNVPQDRVFGEHEIDYVLIIQKDVKVVPNTNEVMSHRYVTRDELKQLIDDRDGVLITPWFRLIADQFLFTWWNSLHCLDTQVDRATIHRFV